MRVCAHELDGPSNPSVIPTPARLLPMVCLHPASLFTYLLRKRTFTGHWQINNIGRTCHPTWLVWATSYGAGTCLHRQGPPISSPRYSWDSGWLDAQWGLFCWPPATVAGSIQFRVPRCRCSSDHHPLARTTGRPRKACVCLGVLFSNESSAAVDIVGAGIIGVLFLLPSGIFGDPLMN